MQNKWMKISLFAVGALLLLCVFLGASVFVVGLTNHQLVRQSGFTLGFLAGPHHGAVGTIQRIDQPSQTITLQLLDGTTLTVLINSETHIEKVRKKIAFTDLTVGERMTVIGSPDDQGRFVARWIHVFSSTGSASIRIFPRRVHA